MDIEIVCSRDVDASPDVLAAWFTRFQGMSAWHPAVERAWGEGEGPGARRVFVAGPAEVEEELVERGPHHLEYTIVRSPHPIRGYRARLAVAPQAGGSRVRWWCTLAVEPVYEEAVRAGFRAFYEAGLEGLAQRVRADV